MLYMSDKWLQINLSRIMIVKWYIHSLLSPGQDKSLIGISAGLISRLQLLVNDTQEVYRQIYIRDGSYSYNKPAVELFFLISQLSRKQFLISGVLYIYIRISVCTPVAQAPMARTCCIGRWRWYFNGCWSQKCLMPLSLHSVSIWWMDSPWVGCSFPSVC